MAGNDYGFDWPGYRWPKLWPNMPFKQIYSRILIC